MSAAAVPAVLDPHPPDGEEGGPALPAGELLAPGYRVLGHLRRGRALDVYEVWSEERACRCVAKVLCPDRMGDLSAHRRLVREGRILLRLAHPHLVRAYELLERPQPVLILETLTGATLEHLIEGARRRLPMADVACLGQHLCSAIHYLHRHGYLHLDLKPSNVVAQCGLAKVLDLSIARPPGPGLRGEGTRQYMAPEQACGDLLSAATDVWGIGAVLFEAATGRPPFRAYDDRYDQLERRADPVRAHRRVRAAFAAALDACLEPDPAQRPTVDDLAASLERLAVDLTRASPGPSQSGWPPT